MLYSLVTYELNYIPTQVSDVQQLVSIIIIATVGRFIDSYYVILSYITYFRFIYS